MRSTAQQIHQHLQNARQIVIVAHQNPDGDALGSASALREYCRQHSQKAVIFCATPVETRWHYLPHIAEVTTNPQVIIDPNTDTVVILDSGDLRYAGVTGHLRQNPATIINFDHHHTNEQFGHFNFNYPAAATTEVIFDFFKHNQLHVNHHQATALLTGLITDTDNFTNSATSASALLIASELLNHGANLNEIMTIAIKNKSINALRLWGEVLTRLTVRTGLQPLVYTYIKANDLKKFNVQESEAEGIANFLNNLGHDGAALILRETDSGQVKGSFRTTRDDIDVSAWAKKLGGGGHKKAAGFMTTGTIEEVLSKILTTE